MTEMTARNMAHDACAWVSGHLGDFSRLMAVMQVQADKGNPCAKQGEIEFYAREAGIEIDVTGTFRHNRNLYPALARYMVMLRPSLAKTINFRKSKLDYIDLTEVWHEVVDPCTAFAARSRMEAEAMIGGSDGR